MFNWFLLFSNLPPRWVTFTGELGDLELISAYPYSWEVQSLVTSGGDPTPLGGSFTVEFGGYVSEELPYDASADGVKAALEALPGTGMVDVEQTVLDNGQHEWLVTFRDLVGDVDMVVADGSGLTGTSAAIGATEVSQSTTTHLRIWSGEEGALVLTIRPRGMTFTYQEQEGSEGATSCVGLQ